MSAKEVLQQVKAMRPRERQRFFDSVGALEAKIKTQAPGKPKRRVGGPDLAGRRRRIVGDKVLLNLVLLARDEENY